MAAAGFIHIWRDLMATVVDEYNFQDDFEQYIPVQFLEHEI